MKKKISISVGATIFLIIAVIEITLDENRIENRMKIAELLAYVAVVIGIVVTGIGAVVDVVVWCYKKIMNKIKEIFQRQLLEQIEELNNKIRGLEKYKIVTSKIKRLIEASSVEQDISTNKTAFLDTGSIIEILKDEWTGQEGLVNPSKPESESEPISRKGRLSPFIMIMPNEEIINERTGTDTFVKVIENLGIEKVKRLSIIVVQSRNLNLVSDVKDPFYAQRQSGQYYIGTNTNAETKIKYLEQIASGLGLKMDRVNKDTPPVYKLSYR